MRSDSVIRRRKEREKGSSGKKSGVLMRWKSEIEAAAKVSCSAGTNWIGPFGRLTASSQGRQARNVEGLAGYWGISRLQADLVVQVFLFVNFFCSFWMQTDFLSKELTSSWILILAKASEFLKERGASLGCKRQRSRQLPLPTRS